MASCGGVATAIGAGEAVWASGGRDVAAAGARYQQGRARGRVGQQSHRRLGLPRGDRHVDGFAGGSAAGFRGLLHLPAGFPVSLLHDGL
eukprot:12897162-Prorocentrum_lima.AAC.1